MVGLDRVPEVGTLRDKIAVLADTVKMIAYRAETALVALLRPHLAKEDSDSEIVAALRVQRLGNAWIRGRRPEC